MWAIDTIVNSPTYRPGDFRGRHAFPATQREVPLLMNSVTHGAQRTGGDARRSTLACVLVIVMLCTGVISQESSSEYTFRSKSELVLVNVTVRDRNGNPCAT